MKTKRELFEKVMNLEIEGRFTKEQEEFLEMETLVKQSREEKYL